ncbi:MAG: N-acetylmuramoyl-L-alanine amidase [Sumerlaeia bacterium]
MMNLKITTGLVLMAWAAPVLLLAQDMKPTADSPPPLAPEIRGLTQKNIAPEEADLLPDMGRGLPHSASYLRGLRVAIDPGHGGDIGPQWAGFKRGPSGLREAVINQNTSNRLAELLREAGAEVLLIRTEDIDISLADRARMANEWQADLYVSVHHNASARASADYSSVWYHGTGAERPASIDVAREMAASLVTWMRPGEPQHSGIYSDFLMYESGFGVLRMTEMTAVLAECSFYTHPPEEDRLAMEAYNDRMAATLFLGLCEWARAGIPRWEITAAAEDASATQSLTVELDDAVPQRWGREVLRHFPGSLRVTVNGEDITPPEEEALDKTIELTAPLLFDTSTTRTLDVRFQNRNKNSAITPPKTLAPGQSWAALVVEKPEPEEDRRGRGRGRGRD